MELPAGDTPLHSLLYQGGDLENPLARRVNMVCDAFLDTEIPLDKVQKMYHAKLDRISFSALFMWFRHRSLMCIMFQTGKVIITGGKEIKECLLALSFVADCVARVVGRDCQILSKRISNVVVTLSMPACEGSLITLDERGDKHLDLDELYAMNSLRAKYNPEGFPGLQIGHSNPKFTGVYFRSGKVNIMGARDLDVINEATRKLPSIIKARPGYKPPKRKLEEYKKRVAKKKRRKTVTIKE